MFKNGMVGTGEVPCHASETVSGEGGDGQEWVMGYSNKRELLLVDLEHLSC